MVEMIEARDVLEDVNDPLGIAIVTAGPTRIDQNRLALGADAGLAFMHSHPAGRGWQVESQILRRARHEPRLLRFGPRIHVTFEQDDLGTRVTIKGRCEREFCDALELLGAPGHWPTAESRRDG